MGVPIAEMRSAVSKAYNWKNKVGKMSDKQVTAIYLSLKKRGVI